jgi:hypothetical protein
MSRRVKCPTPHKVAYRKQLDAKLALMEIQRKGKPGHDEQRYYKCSCKGFHLTSWD